MHAHYVAIDHPHATAGDSAHGQLPMRRNTQLAYEHQVQGQLQRRGNLVVHGDATARQGQHNGV
ncbi:hypothetical protein D3C80_1763310 [compost metagenome]